jgi:hypothetical protein
MMRLPLSFLFVFIINLACAQQGRHELPIDTISIGGEEQERKMTHLKGYDELLTQLTQVRDSIAGAAGVHDMESLSRENSDRNANIDELPSDYLSRLDELIGEMEKKEGDKNLMNQGYDLLDRIRRSKRAH